MQLSVFIWPAQVINWLAVLTSNYNIWMMLAYFILLLKTFLQIYDNWKQKQQHEAQVTTLYSGKYLSDQGNDAFSVTRLLKLGF